MVRHNNVVPNQHFHKISWQNRVKTWFEQPMRKKRRRAARMKKAAAIAPRPVSGLLRPVVKPPTVRYNYKLREGRGFTLTELKEAGIDRKEARSIGIAVDHRRRNKSNESLQLNSQRLPLFCRLLPRLSHRPLAPRSRLGELVLRRLAYRVRDGGGLVPLAPRDLAVRCRPMRRRSISEAAWPHSGCKQPLAEPRVIVSGYILHSVKLRHDLHVNHRRVGRLGTADHHAADA